MCDWPCRWVLVALGLFPFTAPQAALVTADPPTWDFGVRNPNAAIVSTVRLTPPPDSKLQVKQVMGSDIWLQPRIRRSRGSAAAAAEIEIRVDTAGQTGGIAGSVFVTFSGDGETALRIPVSGWVRSSRGPAHVEVYFARSDPMGAALANWWRTVPVGNGLVELLPIEEIANYRRLRERQKAMPETSAADVVAYVDHDIALCGLAKVKAGLVGLLDLDASLQDDIGAGGGIPALSTDAVLEELGMVDPASSANDRQSLEIWFFYFANCRSCEAARQVIDRIKRDLGNRGSVVTIDATKQPLAISLAYSTLGRYEDAPTTVPSAIAFVGDTLLVGADEIVSYCRMTAEAQLARGNTSLRVRRPECVLSLRAYTQTFGLWPVIAAALADGVNPCAFAAIVLLISVLSMRTLVPGSDEKRRILLGGSAFCIGVFSVYYASGLAIFAGVQKLRALPLLDAVVFWILWLLAALGGVLSVRDAVTYLRTRDAKQLALRVPPSIQARFGAIMRGQFRKSGLISGGLVAGGIIAILEGVCTGQMYLPTIQYMVREPDLRMRGAFYLLIYNLIFMLPLFTILSVALVGVHFRRLSGFQEKHLVTAKLLLAAVFIFLATAMLVQRFGH